MLNFFLARVQLEVAVLGQPPSNTQRTTSLQQLLIQLSQASTEPIIDPSHGGEVSIDRLIFVTPYTIPQTTLDNHKTAFRKVIDEYNCKIIDGTKLISLIKKHRPDLLSVIFEPTHILTSSIRNKLKNSQLMKALNKRVSRDVSEIYCDISFFFGRGKNGNRRIFNIVSNNPVEIIRVKVDSCTNYKRLHSIFLSLFGKDLFDLKSLDKTQLSIEQEKQLRNKLTFVKNNIDRSIEELQKAINNLELTNNATQQLKKAMFHRGADYRMALNDIAKADKDFTSDYRKQFNENTKSLRSTLHNLIIKTDRINEDLEQNHVDMRLNTKILSEHLNRELTSFIKNSPSTVDECRMMLKRMMLVQDIYSLTKEFPGIFREIDQESKSTTSRLDIHLESVFQTGLNIAVLGEAGSGKTTSLQMYAKQLLAKDDEEFVIYIPLVDLGNYNEKGRVNILNSLTKYLQSIGIRATMDDVKEYLNNENSVLMLDSIDEGIAVYPEIVDSLLLFVKSFPKCQVITSSRMLVLKDLLIPFCQVTLLPFNREQLSLFVSKWFKDDDKAISEINQHLEDNKKLLNIVTNPLSATILCVLYENKVPLPRSESSLYHTRLDLLSGKFDREKMLSRLVNPSSVLIEQAKLVGYEMHKSRVRDASIQDVEAFLSINVLNKDSILQDFLTSEIMVHVSSTHLSFGHLRFQEFLASEEIKSRRSFPTDKLLRDPWWAGPLFLYAQSAREIDWLFNHAIANDYAYEVREILRNIAALRSKKESDALIKRINISIVDHDYNEGEEYSGTLYF